MPISQRQHKRDDPAAIRITATISTSRHEDGLGLVV